MGGALRPCEREVEPTFDELALIARTLALRPMAFLAVTRSGSADESTRPTLDLGGAQVGLALARPRGRCVFLLELASRPLCGLGALAPASCRWAPSAPVGPYAGGPRPDPDRQTTLEARWHERVQHRAFPLDPETALDGILALTAETP
jgi:hypothetical protein